MWVPSERTITQAGRNTPMRHVDLFVSGNRPSNIQYPRGHGAPASRAKAKVTRVVPIRFTTDKLLDFLKRLDRKVTIRIAPHKAGEPYQEISLAS
jgi:hypothetical protein